MDRLLYGGLDRDVIEVIERDGRRYIRYDAGAHQIAMREDELTQEEFELVIAGGKTQDQGMRAMQARLTANGIDAYVSNWRQGDEG